MRLTAAILSRNESKVIERCLQSLTGVDEIVILDTGSTDNTIAIARKYRALVYHDVWQDDFSLHRNKLLTYCTGDYILSIDCDETLIPGSINKIKESIDNKYVYTVTVRTDETSSIQSRIFRRSEKVYWNGKCHEYLNRAVDRHIPVVIISRSDGYSRKHDPGRNIRILKKALEENPNQAREMYYMGLELQSIGECDRAIYYLTEAGEMYPDIEAKGEVHLRIALCYLVLGRQRRALHHLHEAIRFNPDISRAYDLLESITKKTIYGRIGHIAMNQNVNIVTLGNDYASPGTEDSKN
jgi:glycosyltransferase involved in cell wall biosynthesis